MTHDPLCPKTLHEYEHDDYTYYCDDRGKCESEYPLFPGICESLPQAASRPGSAELRPHKPGGQLGGGENRE